MRNNEIKELSIIRSLMILCIFITHYYEFFNPGDSAAFGNPSAGWPSLGERFAQLRPLEYVDWTSIVENIYRYLALFGDQGVQIFFLISAFVLTLGFERKKNGLLTYKEFLSKRFFRIYPAWILAHSGLVLTWIIFGAGISLFSINTWLSMAGVRIIPSLYYYGSPAWWFVGCLLQLYLIYPFVYNCTIGKNLPVRLLYLIVISTIIRLCGLVFLSNYFPHYLDAWSRGLFFIVRMPEFLIGIYFADKYMKNRETTLSFIKSSRGIIIALGIWLAGNILSFTLIGMSVSFLLTGIGGFCLLWGLLLKIKTTQNNLLLRLNNISYEFYLVHHVIILYIAYKLQNIVSFHAITIILIFTITLIFSIILRRVSRNRYIITFLKKSLSFLWNRKRHICISLLILYLLLIGFELIIQRTNPQEIYGWGERPALQPDNKFGYKLKPSTRTRLMWQSYDYHVNSNSSGFPGMEYSMEKQSGTKRFIITGDAFESAEGVDTEKSWPSLLEEYLNTDSKSNYEVMNFSITGWGPQHYFRALNEYVPQYRPDAVFVALFINDLTDVFITDKAFMDSIGFGRPSPFGFKSTVRLEHTRKLIHIKKGRLLALINKNRYPYDYYLGHPDKFLIKNYPKLKEGQQLVSKYLKNILLLCEKYDSDLYIILVPSSLQSADPGEINYIPENIDLRNNKLYDLNQPQNLLIEICDNLNLKYYDLRELFQINKGRNIFQPDNMHFTKNGHKITAEWMKENILKLNYNR